MKKSIVILVIINLVAFVITQFTGGSMLPIILLDIWFVVSSFLMDTFYGS